MGEKSSLIYSTPSVQVGPSFLSVKPRSPPPHLARVNDPFRENNFDLIRLCAALQVALLHGMHHLGIEEHPLVAGLSILPGVPIFFFISGFLISKSYETNTRLAEYSLNRVLRIYPALVACTFLAVGSVFLAGYQAIGEVSAGRIAVWIVAQITFLQFYNPEFMRQFGSGVLNGSLWTITVELQFYMLVPLYYHLVSRWARTTRQWNLILGGSILVFLAANASFHRLSAAGVDTLATKLIEVTFVPWFYMFLVGVLVQRNFKVFHRLLAGKAVVLLVVYVVAAYFASRLFDLTGGNRISPFLYLPLAAVVFACAYSQPALAERLLRRNDISYGVYIYHMPVVNLLLYFGLKGELRYLAAQLALTVLAAMASWVWVERPALRLKKHPLCAVLWAPQGTR